MDDVDDTVIGLPRYSVALAETPDEDTVVTAVPVALVEPGELQRPRVPQPDRSEAGRSQSDRIIPGERPDRDLPPQRGGVGRASRAAFYRFRVNGGAPIPLDSPVLIGRRPRASRRVEAVEPRLVVVGSPRNEVSSTHLELHQEGSSVIVTDMRSTNGTVVRMPGAAALTMRPGESLVASPGTLVDIGDGNLIEVLPVQRNHPSQAHERFSL